MNTYLILLSTAIFLIFLDKLINQHNSQIPIDKSYHGKNCTYNQDNILECNDIYEGIRIISVMGGPGSGKGTQCQYMKNKFGFKHISLGELIRQKLKNGGKQAEELSHFIKQGKLIPSQIGVELILNQLKKYRKGDTILLDGFPRNQQNLRVWHIMTGGNKNLRIKDFINFQCPTKVLQARLVQRAKTSGRQDDNLQTIRKRINTFVQQTQTVLDQIQDDQWNTIIQINSDREVQEVSEDLRKKLTQSGYRPVN